MIHTVRVRSSLAGAVAVVLGACALEPAPAHAKKGKWSQAHPAYASFSDSTPPEVQGKVSHLVMTPFGEVDGLLLEQGVLVTFPKHMGRRLAAAVRPGDSVDVRGVPEMPGQLKGYAVTNQRTRQTLVVQPKPPGEGKVPGYLRRMGLKSMRAEGKIRHVRHGKRGEVNGLILTDGTVIKFPKHLSYQFADLLQVGQVIQASGYGTQNGHGRSLEVTTLAPSGQPAAPTQQNGSR